MQLDEPAWARAPEPVGRASDVRVWWNGAVVPTVDLEAADAPAMLDTAARTIGMFRLIGHGIDVGVIQRAHAIIRRVFAVPEDERSAAGGLGFQALGAETLAGNTNADKSFSGDLKETFTVRFGHGVEVPWPAAVPDAGVALGSYDAAMAIIAGRLLGVADRALGLEAGTLRGLCLNPSVVLRALHYPPSRSDQLRAGAHTDFGTLSFLTLSGDLQGLQVRSTDGSWEHVNASPPMVLVNFGEIFARLTGGTWIAPMHRVAGQGDHRYTLAWFHAPARDRTIAPLPQALTPGAHPYPPITVGELLTERIKAQRPGG